MTIIAITIPPKDSQHTNRKDRDHEGDCVDLENQLHISKIDDRMAQGVVVVLFFLLPQIISVELYAALVSDDLKSTQLQMESTALLVLR